MEDRTVRIKSRREGDGSGRKLNRNYTKPPLAVTLAPASGRLAFIMSTHSSCDLGCATPPLTPLRLRDFLWTAVTDSCNQARAVLYCEMRYTSKRETAKTKTNFVSSTRGKT